MKPLILIPTIKDYIWGGTKLRDEFGKKSDLQRLAESWELSCHKDGESIISNGEYKGKTLTEYLEANPDALGKNCGRFEYFPVLIKLIDARDNLSVQVHPNDEYAKKIEGEYGKTEMWYIADCEEGASLIYGFKDEISEDDFRNAIEKNTLLDKVNIVPVKKGDVFFIESGTLHAIGKGILIAEIQQNSNTTYRVYDYGRIGADGKPRDLHIDKAIEVTNLQPTIPYKTQETLSLNGIKYQELVKCDYFHVEKYDITTPDNELCLYEENSFIHILVIDGKAVIQCEEDIISIEKGSSIFIPADSEKCIVKGDCSIITTKIN